MATALKLKNDIKKLKAAINSKATPKSFVPKLKAQLDKAENELESLKKGGRPRKTSTTKGTQSTLSALQKLIQKKKYSVYQDAGVDLKKDAGEGALATGRRVSKGLKSNQWGDASDNKGNVYYEYRANRLDVKQPKKKQTYPKLEKGGMMADGGLTFETDMKPHFTGVDRYYVTTSDGKKKEFTSVKEFNSYLESLKKEGYKRMASGGMMADGGFFDTKSDVKFKFSENEKIKVLQYDGGKLKKLGATIIGQYAAEQPDGTYYPFYWVVGDWNNAGKQLYAEDELIERHGNKPKKMADGGKMNNSLNFIPTKSEKYYDKKEKQSLTIGTESDIPNVYNVIWEDGEHSIYSKKNIDFLVEKGIWKKMDKGSYMAKGGEVVPYIIWVSKDGDKREFYGEYKSQRAAEMAMNKLWDKGEYESMGNKPKSSYEKNGLYASGGILKGRNNDTGETFGVVIGSVKKADDELEGAIKMNVRTSYSSRISEVQLVFDKNGNLYSITDFGYGINGEYPDTNGGSGRTYNADKKETLEVLSKKYNSAFAKKLIELAKGNAEYKGYMADGGEVGEGFTIAEMNQKLNKMFPDSFGFTLGNISKEGNEFINHSALIVNSTDPYRGLEDKDIQSKLFFPQYKRDHDIRFRIYQGGENTYFYFILESENGDQYIGQFGFKDQGDVPSDYVTRFLAFLMEQYGLPFKVEHSVMKHGGELHRTQE